MLFGHYACAWFLYAVRFTICCTIGLIDFERDWIRRRGDGEGGGEGGGAVSVDNVSERF